MTDAICQCPRCGRMHRDLGFGKPPSAISRDTIAISGIHLMRHGDRVIVAAEIEGRWIEVIRELHESNFGHIVEPGGMRRAVALTAGERT